METVQAWLNCSGASHISLSITFDDITPALQVLFASILKWLQHLELGVYYQAELMALFLGSGTKKFPALESLKLHSGKISSPSFWSTVEIFKVSGLHKVSLQLCGNPMTLLLHWGELIELDLQCFMTWPMNNGGWEGGLRAPNVVDILCRFPHPHTGGKGQGT
ncbi:hypothetical protein B0H17DRAFT_1128227 [Mycena rosella]|uniref:Uncharacterized protein n=1 Tax=Mycena rosella TaxID=1033263 RepID=A0AAD7DWG6_MYCRO|nr:hypothetical protein B0H17DRAFT_1128227 [Mycena rosella]